MNGYPEWFIGGPWHGEDKRVRAPNLDRVVHVAMNDPIDYRDIMNNPDPMTTISFHQVMYVPQRCVIFGVQLTVWVLNDEVPNLQNINSETSRLLGELIMFPHRDNVAAESLRGPIDRYRLRWEIEREVRADLEREYRRQVRDAVSTVRMTPPPAPERTERHKLRPDVTHGVYIELITDDNREIVMFDKVTTYFDQGNEEVSPAWVATAQGEGQHSETRPYTGYGTSERAAILALAADKLGVYARMVELETEVSS